MSSSAMRRALHKTKSKQICPQRILFQILNGLIVPPTIGQTLKNYRLHLIGRVLLFVKFPWLSLNIQLWVLLTNFIIQVVMHGDFSWWHLFLELIIPRDLGFGHHVRFLRNIRRVHCRFSGIIPWVTVRFLRNIQRACLVASSQGTWDLEGMSFVDSVIFSSLSIVTACLVTGDILGT
jgi:hypothetical protein